LRELISRGAKFEVRQKGSFWTNYNNAHIFHNQFDPKLRLDIFNAISKADLPLNEYFEYVDIVTYSIRSQEAIKSLYTPLQFAIKKNEIELAKVLLKAGANPDFENCSPLKMAKAICMDPRSPWTGRKDMMALLIEYGAKVDGV
jgi:ankyrin repeat protein